MIRYDKYDIVYFAELGQSNFEGDEKKVCTTFFFQIFFNKSVLPVKTRSFPSARPSLPREIPLNSC